jgi:uncharacterized surface protein with fasciclin (FAS1) repeats
MDQLRKIHSLLFIITVFLLLVWGCQENVFEQEKYQTPSWVKGKIFSQIQKEEDLKTFISCLKKTGYDTILDVSGSYTVFAPTNDAFSKFFEDHPDYNSVSDVTVDKLEELVQYQIIYNAWSKEQFQMLQVGGWIDPEDKLNEPQAYKRKTLFQEENKSYPASRRGNNFQIAKESEATTSKKAFTQSNKYAPIFYDQLLYINNLTKSDYEFYFNRPFESQNLYVANAALSEQIPAENGFIYKTDRVVSPLPNGEEILEEDYNGHSYNKFLHLVHEFSEFNANLEETYNQPGAEQGLDIDTLYNLRYPDLIFNIHNELTGNTNNEKYTQRDHHGLMAPTDEAFESFLNEYLSGWGGIEDLPRGTKRILVNSHMSENAVYPTNIKEGFINGENDRVFLNEGDIIQKTYGSNCSFLGLNKTIVPRVIKSVCKPMYITQDYLIMKHAVEQTRVISALKNPNADYAFYLPRDKGIGVAGDSSLILEITNPELDRFHFESFDMRSEEFEKRTTGDLRSQILNQIGISTPQGGADKEFIRNLGDNYIVVNNKDGTARGTSPNTFGYNGDSTIQIEPELYSGEADNGKIYSVKTFFDYSSIKTYFGLLSSTYPRFLNLLTKAGLYRPAYYDLPFLIDGANYTVFIPSNQAMDEYKVDTLSKKQLRKFLKYHFVRKDLIFTDGNKPEGNYTTTLLGESSEAYSTQYSHIHIRPKPNVIEILDKNGNIYLEIHEQEGETNHMIRWDSDDESESRWDFITTGVVHHIDKVLIKDSLHVN